MEHFLQTGTGTTDNNLPDYFQQYQNVIKMDPVEQKNLMDNYQTLEPISSQIGLDNDLKTNALLEFALKNPRQYIKLRTDYLTKLKKDINLHFQKVYNQLRVSSPAIEARNQSLIECQKYYKIELDRLETMYPSKFGDQSLKNEIQRQLAQNRLNLSNDAATNAATNAETNINL